MTQVDDLSRSLAAFDQNTSLVLVVEMSEASWLVAGLVPSVDRQPLKKLEPDPSALLRLLERWQGEAMKAGQTIGRVTLAYEGLVEDTRESHPQAAAASRLDGVHKSLLSRTAQHHPYLIKKWLFSVDNRQSHLWTVW